VKRPKQSKKRAADFRQTTTPLWISENPWALFFSCPCKVQPL